LAVVVLLAAECSMASTLRKINVYNQKNKMFQGDIANLPRNPKNRNAITSGMWTNATIPYTNEVASKNQALVRSAMDRIERNTCIRFIPKTNQFNYLRIVTTNDGCYSNVGMIGGPQDLSLQDNNAGTCMIFETVIHELLHACGLFHEQSRFDRDDYITVMYDNIEEGDKSQFRKIGLGPTSYYNTVYDYLSVMHYDQYAFSKNNQRSIVSKVAAYQNQIGNVKDASATDFLKINRMYNCPTTGQPVTTPPPVRVTTPPPVRTVAPPTRCRDTIASWICRIVINDCSDVNVYTYCRRTCNRCI